MIMKTRITIILIIKIANNKNKSNFKYNTRKKSVYIVGDSMVKEVNGFELSKSIA